MENGVLAHKPTDPFSRQYSRYMEHQLITNPRSKLAPHGPGFSVLCLLESLIFHDASNIGHDTGEIGEVGFDQVPFVIAPGFTEAVRVGIHAQYHPASLQPDTERDRNVEHDGNG